MNLIKRCLLSLGSCLIALTGCAKLNVLYPLSGQTSTSNEKAYIYGSFKLARPGIQVTRLLLRIEEVERGTTAEITLREMGSQVYAVAVAPGTYRVKGLVLTKGGPPAMLLSNEASAGPLPPSAQYLNKAVRMSGGKGYYLGDFEGETDFGGDLDVTVLSGALKRVTQNFNETTAEFKRRYPRLAAIDCLAAYGPDSTP